MTVTRKPVAKTAAKKPAAKPVKNDVPWYERFAEETKNDGFDYNKWLADRHR